MILEAIKKQIEEATKAHVRSTYPGYKGDDLTGGTWNSFEEGAEFGYSLSQSKISELEKALGELVDLKIIKDQIDLMSPYEQGINNAMVEDYKKRKPLAWEVAKTVLAKHP